MNVVEDITTKPQPTTSASQPTTSNQVTVESLPNKSL